ncbi:hypothetical protein, partial [Pseudomonas shirazensis]
MNVEKEVLETKFVIGNCGRKIVADHLEHIYFDANSNLCLTLHYLFLCYSPTAVMQHGRQLTRAIGYFFDFLCEYIAIHPQQMHPTKYTDITVELFFQFQDYMLRKDISLLNAEKLRTAMTAVAKQHGTVPLLLLRVHQRPKPKKTEPLSEEAYA